VRGHAVPKVSIGLPVYNGEMQLPRALESLLAQTHEDFEIVVSDNHSTDLTERICREFAASDPRVRYARNEQNRGVAWNFNHVFRLARGRYFKWASSNDLHDPTYVARCVEALEASPGAVLAYAKTRIIDESGAFVGAYEDNLDLPWPDAPRRFREYLTRVGLCNALFGLMRPEVMRRTGLLGDYRGSDVVFLGELSLHGTFVEVPEILFSRRFERENESHDASLDNWQEFFAPTTRRKVFMRRWRHQTGYLLANWRSPLSVADKARVAATIARFGFAMRRELAGELAAAVRTLTARRAPTTRPS
jgi:glycosyltransferase involved in cell wall biosynthesis